MTKPKPFSINPSHARSFNAKWMPVTESGCWVWMGDVNITTNYGRICVNSRKVGAHRFSFQLHFGELRGDDLVLHKCDNTLCVRPDHLYLGNAADNVRDRTARTKLRQSKLDEMAIIAIFHARKNGSPYHDIQERYGVDSMTVWSIANGKRWIPVLRSAGLVK